MTKSILLGVACAVAVVLGLRIFGPAPRNTAFSPRGDRFDSIEVFTTADRLASELPTVAHPGLDGRLPVVDFKGTDLRGTLDWLSRQMHVNVVADWRALERANLYTTTPVHLRLSHVSGRAALRTMLSQLASDYAIGYVLREGVVFIMPSDEMFDASVVQAYDVRDIILDSARFEKAVATRYPRPTREQVKASGLFSGPGGPSDVEIVDTLLMIITDHVNPDTWRDAGGSLGTIHYIPGKLVVGQTPANHRRIEQILREIRQTR